MTALTAVREPLSQSIDVEGESFNLFGKPVRFSITPRARKALTLRESPLWVEMELYFSCLVRKQVRVYEQAPTHEQIMEPLPVTHKLNVTFRPVVTEHCSVADVEDKPDLNTMPVNDPSKMVPKWFNLDFKSGQWLGEFGY